MTQRLKVSSWPKRRPTSIKHKSGCWMLKAILRGRSGTLRPDWLLSCGSWPVIPHKGRLNFRALW